MEKDRLASKVETEKPLLYNIVGDATHSVPANKAPKVELT